MTPSPKHLIVPYTPYFARSADEILRDLELFTALLQKWQKVQNLVSRETPGDIWRRHILDSLQLLPLMYPGSTSFTVLDIGSGGGFPALPLAICLKSSPVHFHLIESNSRKCSFLRAAMREFDLPVTVHTARIEEMDPQSIANIDVLTSRALAALPKLFGYLHRFWGSDSRALLHKGREYGEELRQADSAWVYDVLKHESATDAGGVILEISNLAPAH